MSYRLEEYKHFYLEYIIDKSGRTDNSIEKNEQDIWSGVSKKRMFKWWEKYVTGCLIAVIRKTQIIIIKIKTNKNH